jgi:hypothetical protein
MNTPEFRQLVTQHEAALDGRATVYFRPTDQGLTRIVLHPSAPGYIGFRNATNDNGHIVRPGAAIPSTEQLRENFRSFEVWMKSVHRSSREERGVMTWLRGALTQQLWLPELGEGWVFLHQEWRFPRTSGVGIKSDILAVHLQSGRLGIVEFKSDPATLKLARQQVEEYSALWRHSATELAPLFTTLLQSLGAAYGNELAANAVVRQHDAALFVGVAAPGSPVRVYAHSAAI